MLEFFSGWSQTDILSFYSKIGFFFGKDIWLDSHGNLVIVLPSKVEVCLKAFWSCSVFKMFIVLPKRVRLVWIKPSPPLKLVYR